MLPCPAPPRHGLLVMLMLAALAGCYTEEDARVCENVTCYAGYCIAESGKPICHCDAWSDAAGLSCIQVGLAPDDINDTPGTATPITLSDPWDYGKFDARLQSAGADVDFYSFSAKAGHIYSVTCFSDQAGCDISLRNSGNQILGEASGTPSALVVRELSAGRYIFGLKAQVAGTASDYRFRLEDLGPDDHGDTAADATARAPSPEAFYGRAEDPDDVDVFSWMMTAGHIYRVDCSLYSRRWWLILRDEAGVSLGTPEGSDTYKRLVFEATSSGRAFAELHTAEGTSVQSYSCRFEDLGPDDHGDTVQTASVLMPDVAYPRGRMELPGDTDFFRVTATASHSYRFRCAYACTVGLYDGAGTSQPIQPDPLNFGGWLFQAQGNGDLFLSVSSSEETYSYRLEDLGTNPGVAGITSATPRP